MAKAEMKVIGKSFPIMEAREKATGRSQYTDDMKAELFVKILGSPHPHAMIKSIDVSRAKKLAGVEAVLTYKQVPRKLMPFRSQRACYAMDKHLRHVGDHVVAVAATSEAIAEEALELVDINYEILPAVFDVDEAVKPTAPKIYPEGNINKTRLEAPTLHEWGDISQGFEEADTVVEDSFEVTPQIHAAIEPQVCIARWEEDELTVWAATQTPWELRAMVAYALDIPESKIVVLTPTIGGGFGSKYVGRFPIITCLLARMVSGKSTKLTFTREESQCYTRRPTGKLYAKIGSKKDGTITALQYRAYFDLGAYGPYQSSFRLGAGKFAYKIDNARFEAWHVHTNLFRCDAMRSVLLPFNTYAIESIVDEIAEKLELDPAEIRLKNMPESGDMMPPKPYNYEFTGFERARFDIYPGKKMVQQVMEKIGWRKKWKGAGKPTAIDGPKRRGIGLAYTSTHCGYLSLVTTSIQIAINRDGSAVITSGTQEIGQGINTTLRMLAAESLGLSFEDVSIVTSDTRTGQYDITNARASHQLTSDGHLLLKAIEEAKQKVREKIAPLLETRPDEIEIEGKKAYIKGHPEEAKPMTDLLSTPVTVSATGPPGSIYPEVKPGFIAHQPMALAAEVEVDIETGVVKPIKLVIGLFPGRMINPEVVRGQAIGGAIQSLGMALWEEFKYDEGASAYLSRDFTDYRIPRALDIPEIDTVLLEEVDETSPPHEGLPYGVRGIGEMTGWGGPVVIANAIYNATGVRVKKSPATAEVVLQALRKEPIK